MGESHPKVRSHMICPPSVWAVFKLSCRVEEICDRHNLTTCSVSIMNAITIFKC